MSTVEYFGPIALLGVSAYLSTILILDSIHGDPILTAFPPLIIFVIVPTMVVGAIIYYFVEVIIARITRDIDEWPLNNIETIIFAITSFILTVFYTLSSGSFNNAVASLNPVYTNDFLQYVGIFIAHYIMKLLIFIGMGATLLHGIDKIIDLHLKRF